MISNSFLLLFLISLIGLVIGLIKPSIISKIARKEFSRKKIGLIFGIAITIFFVLTGITTPNTNQEEQRVQETNENIPANSDIETRFVVEEIVPQTLDQSQDIVQGTPAQVVVDVQPVKAKESESQHVYYSVASVVDGDTIKINMNGVTETLRLIGIDTPETVDPRKPVQCFGKESSDKAKELLSNKKVRIEKDSTQGDRDKYGRLLVYVWREDGLFYNEHMIKQGFAHEYTYDLPYKYQAQFKAGQTYARENQLGLWSPTTCNGDTSVAANQTSASAQTSGEYYTSSYHTSKYYYPEPCSAWKSLSSQYLKAFGSLEALLSSYPNRTLSPQCQ